MINQLIINADDFGMTLGTTLGIIEAYKNGIITSSTCMMNMPYTLYALKLAKEFPHLAIGVHLNITVGKPLLKETKSFVDDKGYFRKKASYPNAMPQGDETELYNEWKAQIEKFIEITNHLPSHIDSHHHVHLYPWHQKIALRLAREYNIPMRQREQVLDTYEYVQVFDQMYDENVNYDYFTHVLDTFDGKLEYMCHPALCDQELYEMSSYSLSRMKELQLLTSNKLKQFIKDNSIELINFTNLKKQ